MTKSAGTPGWVYDAGTRPSLLELAISLLYNMIHVEQGGPPEAARAGPGRRASVGRESHVRRNGDKNPAGRRSRVAIVHGVGVPTRRRVVRAGSGLPGRVMLVHDTSADRIDAAQVRPEQHDGETRGRRATCTTRRVSRRCTRDGLHAPGVDGPRHHAPRHRQARLVFAAPPPLSSTRLQGRTVPTPSIRDSRDRCRGGEDHHVDSRETRRTSLRSPRRRDICGPQCRILLSQ